MSSVPGNTVARELDAAVSELDLKSFDAFRLYHFERLSMRGIGPRLGLSESGVSQIIEKAVVAARARTRLTADRRPPWAPLPGPVHSEATPRDRHGKPVKEAEDAIPGTWRQIAAADIRQIGIGWPPTYSR